MDAVRGSGRPYFCQQGIWGCVRLASSHRHEPRRISEHEFPNPLETSRQANAGVLERTANKHNVLEASRLPRVDFYHCYRTAPMTIRSLVCNTTVIKERRFKRWKKIKHEVLWYSFHPCTAFLRVRKLREDTAVSNSLGQKSDRFSSTHLRPSVRAKP